MARDAQPDPDAAEERALGPLVRVIEEAAGDEPWALIGAAAIRLQGGDTVSPNLEFMTTEGVLGTLAEMLGVTSAWGRGAHLVSERLHFLRHGVPVFVFGDPIFHGPYESLAPREVPSLWDARVRVDVGGVGVLCTPLEWELVLAVVLSAGSRIDALARQLRAQGYDSRLIVRLLRESHVAHDTEEALWAILERGR
ncbi:MAG: hypothetical protein FJZ92_10605 [Chloroflexi bacterium]|nr:hypothetical protein [Chloroflexota bacterium]